MTKKSESIEKKEEVIETKKDSPKTVKEKEIPKTDTSKTIKEVSKTEEKERPKKAPKRKKERKIKKFVDIKPDELKKIILDLHNKGKNKSEIGVILRDEHCIPKVKSITQKSIGEILGEEKIEEKIPEDLMSLIKKNVLLKTHLGENKKDFTAKRGYEISLSKIRRLVRYYKAKKRLPKTWAYTDEIGALLVK